MRWHEPICELHNCTAAQSLANCQLLRQCAGHLEMDEHQLAAIVFSFRCREKIACSRAIYDLYVCVCVAVAVLCAILVSVREMHNNETLRKEKEGGEGRNAKLDNKIDSNYRSVPK